MANIRVAYTGLRNPGMVRTITKADWKAASFPGRDEVTWDESNAWRVVLEGVDEDLVDFLKEQPDFRVTDLGENTELSNKAEQAALRADTRAATKTASELDTEPVVDSPPVASGSVGATSPTSTAGTATITEAGTAKP